jgi:dipeptidyl-peptidase-4
MHLRRLLFALVFVTPLLGIAAEDASARFFRDLAETHSYTLGRPFATTPTFDGNAVVFLRGGARDRVLRLYELDLASGKERELITPAQVLAGAAEVISPEEQSRRERSRTVSRGFTAFDLSHDGSRVLVTLSGRLYVVNRGDGSVIGLPGQGWLSPRFSPNGAFVAAVRAGELHVIDLATKTDRALTSGATDTITHGLAEFIAQEEMDRFDGFWWSPDSQSLAYQETDESMVETRYIADPLHPSAEPRKYRYPHAGSANARVRLGVIAREGGPTRWIPWDAEQFPYLLRVVWSEPGAPLTLQVEDRKQHNERLLAADPATGTTRELLRENDPAWLETDHSVPVWLKDGRAFLWSSDRRGFAQLELRDANGSLIRELTPLGAGYRNVIGVDATEEFVYVAASPDPTETQVWKFPLGGGAGTPLTHGRGTHSVRMARHGRVLVHSFDQLDGASGTEVLGLDGHLIAMVESRAEKPALWPRVELTHTRGEPSFAAALVRPRDFEPGRKYPVILSVYGGPQTTVVKASARSYFMDQWLADHGFIVARLDGRGTPLRGREWQRLMYGNFIAVALHDQVQGLQALGEHYPEMDLTRVGVTGWSFGGYFTAMAVLQRPDVFKAAVVGAPVITWENYDTYYTERYIGLPQENEIGYKASSVLTYASQLSRPVLLVHGLTDDNVYVQHTLQLADALFMAGKKYEFMPMLGTHMAGSSDPVVEQHHYERELEFFERTVK